jgi:hypothetical protein
LSTGWRRWTMPKNVPLETDIRKLLKPFRSPEHDAIAADAESDGEEIRQLASAIAALFRENGSDTHDAVRDSKLACPMTDDSGARAQARLALALAFQALAEEYVEGGGTEYWDATMAGLVLMLGDVEHRVRKEAHSGLLKMVDGFPTNLAEALHLLCALAYDTSRPGELRAEIVSAIGDVAAQSRREAERKRLPRFPTLPPEKSTPSRTSSRFSRSRSTRSGGTGSRETSVGSSSTKESKKTRSTRRKLNGAYSAVVKLVCDAHPAVRAAAARSAVPALVDEEDLDKLDMLLAGNSDTISDVAPEEGQPDVAAPGLFHLLARNRWTGGGAAQRRAAREVVRRVTRGSEGLALDAALRLLGSERGTNATGGAAALAELLAAAREGSADGAGAFSDVEWEDSAGGDDGWPGAGGAGGAGGGGRDEYVVWRVAERAFAAEAAPGDGAGGAEGRDDVDGNSDTFHGQLIESLLLLLTVPGSGGGARAAAAVAAVAAGERAAERLEEKRATAAAAAAELARVTADLREREEAIRAKRVPQGMAVAVQEAIAVDAARRQQNPPQPPPPPPSY